MEAWFLACATTLLVLSIFSSRNRPSAGNQSLRDWRIERIEQKVDLILKHLDIKFESDRIILAEVPAEKKIAILKVVRELTNLGLKEAKDLVESAPVPMPQLRTDARVAKRQLEEAGARVIFEMES